MEEKHRILIVDDHALFRAGVRALLDHDPGLEIVGEAADGRDAIRAVGQLAPHLVLMDLTMPEMNGMEAITEIKRRYPDVRVLVLTLHKTEDYIRKPDGRGRRLYPEGCDARGVLHGDPQRTAR